MVGLRKPPSPNLGNRDTNKNKDKITFIPSEGNELSIKFDDSYEARPVGYVDFVFEKDKSYNSIILEKKFEIIENSKTKAIVVEDPSFYGKYKIVFLPEENKSIKIVAVGHHDLEAQSCEYHIFDKEYQIKKTDGTFIILPYNHVNKISV